MTKVNGMFGVKARHQQLLSIFKRLFSAVGVIVSPVSVKSTLIVVKHIFALHHKMGKRGLVKYLKVSSVCLQQCIGGHVLDDVGLLGMRISRNGSGIPRIIPPYFRDEIMKGNPVIIRLCLTIFALYRVLNIHAKVKINSITDPFKGTDANFIDGHINRFCKLFVTDRFMGDNFRTRMYRYSSIFVIWKSSVGSSPYNGLHPFSTHPFTIVKAGLALTNNQVLRKALLHWLRFTENGLAVRIFFYVDSLKQVAQHFFGDVMSNRPLTDLGKLALKHEAAGKMRVFAMVDPFTQWALYPLHKVILALIRRYKMDGTFNQVKPLSHMINSAALYSLDLSSATDRLPISLQVKLLTAISGSPRLAKAWEQLMVGRTFSVPKEAGLSVKRVSYSVGQPMGALSSWAMLALTHHFIVQAAAWNAGLSPSKIYRNYALLGDDLVLGDKSVMIQYLAILKSLGVECGLHKSVISHNGTSLEFAKRTFFKGQDVSPISLTEWYAACGSISDIISFMRKYSLNLAGAAKTLGMGWRVTSSTNKPIGKLNAVLRAISIAQIIPTSPKEVLDLFSLGNKKGILADYTAVLQKFVKIEFSDLRKDIFYAKTETYDRLTHLSLGDSFEGILPKEGPFREACIKILAVLYKPIIERSQKDLNQCMDMVQVRKVPKDLGQVYLKYLEVLKLYSLVPIQMASLQMTRVPSIRGKNPLQVKLWNRWSSIFQGTFVDVPSKATAKGNKQD